MLQMLWISIMSMREPISNLLPKNVTDGEQPFQVV